MKLLVLDVEGTIFKTRIRLPGTTIDSTIWQTIAYQLGPAAVDEEVATHRKWADGGYRNYMEWMQDTIAIHRRHGLREAQFRTVIEAAEFSDGVVDVLSRLLHEGFQIVLVSGGFRELATRAQKAIGIVHAFAACEYFFDKAGRLSGYNLLPCDFRGKIDFINLMLREYGIADSQWAFVGDGANDVPIAQAAPLSLGYHAHPDLKHVVTHTVDSFHELPKLLR
jgi:phosphoserine phosphatase